MEKTKIVNEGYFNSGTYKYDLGRKEYIDVTRKDILRVDFEDSLNVAVHMTRATFSCSAQDQTPNRWDNPYTEDEIGSCFTW